LGRFVDASSCTLQFRDADFNVVGPLITTSTVDPATVAAYVAHYGRIDPLGQRLGATEQARHL